MDCLDCKNETDLKDTTFSSINTKRASKGEHTGDIYYCESCQKFWLDNFITGKIEEWNY